jgi:hypothetical protein
VAEIASGRPGASVAHSGQFNPMSKITTSGTWPQTNEISCGADEGLPRGIEDEVRHHMRRAAAERNVVVERDRTPTASGFV